MPWKTAPTSSSSFTCIPAASRKKNNRASASFLTDEPPHRSMVDIGMVVHGIDIPAGERAYRTRDEFSVPVEIGSPRHLPPHAPHRPRFQAHRPSARRRAIRSDLDQRLGLQLAKPVSMRPAPQSSPPEPRSSWRAFTTTRLTTSAIPSALRSASLPASKPPTKCPPPSSSLSP